MTTISFTLAGRRFELSHQDVLTRLAQARPRDISQYWVDIDSVRWPVKQVMSLATGLRNDEFQSQNARRLLLKLGFVVGKGREKTAPSSIAKGGRQHQAPEPRPVPVQADVVLVGCVKSKLTHGAPAKDLYTSDYFGKMRSYALASGLPWFILSAEHGLVSPDAWLEPYDCYLPEMSRDYRAKWGTKVAEQLEAELGSLSGVTVDVHAGSAYVMAAHEPLTIRGATVLDQLQGLSFGHRLSWYVKLAAEPTPISEVTALLREQPKALTPDRILALKGAGLRSPGVYSWWVDESGARDLSEGLGHDIEPGLIYAGLAGATRSGGALSSNTLWGRIATMHLGKRRDLSTLRLSLFSVLAETLGAQAVTETELTRWMHAHLQVIAVPVTDADSLGAVESAVLAELDPPLNLAKMPKTARRVRLSELRKKHAASTER